MHNGICVRLTETKYLFQDVILTKNSLNYTSESLGDSIIASCYNFNYWDLRLPIKVRALLLYFANGPTQNSISISN